MQQSLAAVVDANAVLDSAEMYVRSTGTIRQLRAAQVEMDKSILCGVVTMRGDRVGKR